MKQAATRDLYRIWTALRGARPAPQRADIDPARLVAILPHVFLLENLGGQPGRFRLAGTHICTAFNAELRDRPFEDLWRAEDRPMIRELLDTVREEAASVVIGASEDAMEADAFHAELLLLPIRTVGTGNGGIVGSCVIRAADGILRRPLISLAIESQRVSWPTGRAQPRERIAVPALVHHIDARREGRFFVYDGGRT